MWPVSREFIAALQGSHAIEVRATAFLGDAVISGAEDLSVDGGTVRVDGRSNVRRSLSGLRVVSTDGTAALCSLLGEPGTEILVERGVRYPTGRVEYAPVGRFRIDSLTDDLEQDGAVTIEAPDRSARILDDRFLAPRSATEGITIVEQITRLIQESIPGALVYDESGSLDPITGGVVWERDRLDAVISLGQAIGCDVFADPSGAFRIRPTRGLSSVRDWIVAAGTRGVLLGGQRAASREGVANLVVASSSATDGSVPVYAIAEDADPLSPTYVAGPFGRVPRFFASPLLSTSVQCQSAADSILARTLGARGTLALSSIVNPALEVGDRIDVVLPDGTVQRHVVDSFDLPLDPDNAMAIATRSAPEVEDSEE